MNLILLVVLVLLIGAGLYYYKKPNPRMLLPTPTGLAHDPRVDYWDDPAINFPSAPTKPIPPGLTALCQNDCYCSFLFPHP